MIFTYDKRTLQLRTKYCRHGAGIFKFGVITQTKPSNHLKDAFLGKYEYQLVCSCKYTPKMNFSSLSLVLLHKYLQILEVK